MVASLPLRLLALCLALAAGAAATAPPCLDLLAGGDECVGGEADHGCDDGCCDEDGCAADCSDCACCPLRAPATVSVLAIGLPQDSGSTLQSAVLHPAPTLAAEGVFRPPRLGPLSHS